MRFVGNRRFAQPLSPGLFLVTVTTTEPDKAGTQMMREGDRDTRLQV